MLYLKQMKVKVTLKVTQSCPALCDPMDSPWNSPGQNCGVGSLSLLQGIFPTQGSNQDSCIAVRILYQLSHKGSPTILEWVAYPFPSELARPRNRTGVSCIADEFFTNWAIREAQNRMNGNKWLSMIQGMTSLAQAQRRRKWNWEGATQRVCLNTPSCWEAEPVLVFRLVWCQSLGSLCYHLLSASLLRLRTLTSSSSIQEDVMNT